MHLNKWARLGLMAGFCGAGAGPAIGGGTVVYDEDFESAPFVAGPLHMQGGWIASQSVTLLEFDPAAPGFDFGTLSMRVPSSAGPAGVLMCRAPFFQQAFGELSVDIHFETFGSDLMMLEAGDFDASIVVARVQVTAGDFLRVFQDGEYEATEHFLLAGSTINLRIRAAADGALTVRVDDELVFTGLTAPKIFGVPSNGVDGLQVRDFSEGGDIIFPSAMIVDNIRFDAEFPCPADLNGDGVVSGADLALALGSWGACPPPTPVTIQDMFVDDFSNDLGWTVSGPEVNGMWERASPEASPSQPGQDTTPGDDNLCYITGARGGLFNDDVDDETILTSPVFAATAPTPSEAFISYNRWFYSSQSFGTPDDFLIVEISNDDGASWTHVESVSGNLTEWVSQTIQVSDFITPSDQMRIRFRAIDGGVNTIRVDAALDDVRVYLEIAPIPQPCPSDFSGDGQVSAADLSLMLGAWGPCP